MSSIFGKTKTWMTPHLTSSFMGGVRGKKYNGLETPPRFYFRFEDDPSSGFVYSSEHHTHVFTGSFSSNGFRPVLSRDTPFKVNREGARGSYYFDGSNDRLKFTDGFPGSGFRTTPGPFPDDGNTYGRLGDALVFTGSDGDHAFTLSAWIKPIKGNSYHTIIHKGAGHTSNLDYMFALRDTDNDGLYKLRLRISDDSSNAYLQAMRKGHTTTLCL